MTAGVLWMTPEMMPGEKYDEKADIFSFGVVLSEVDSHALPYTNSRRAGRTSEVAALQHGKLQIEFSQTCPPSIVEIGKACVARTTDSPTAAEALDKLQLALAGQE
ncbi:unnamed protein product [Phytophthora lilii]|uniref:Unnamed protein product n=1 Tax=Phytophthora lilii TaxID=2077276 RepID=A0A9W6X5L4_9STRA|nr:unnamed protein product [Phytophthora lilii]